MKTLTLFAAAVLAIVTTGCHSNDKVPSESAAIVKVMAAAAPQESPKIVFGTEQNDAEGYGGLAWGSEPREADKSWTFGPRYEGDTSWWQDGWQFAANEVLEKIVGAPGGVSNIGQGGDVGDQDEWVFFPSDETEPKMACHQRESDGAYYCYYRGKLAWVSTRVEGDFQQVQADIERKYSTGLDVRANAWGDTGTQQGVGGDDACVGKLYKRLNTNTRIYLIQHLSGGHPMRFAYLLYIPNAYLTAIHDEWWAAFEQAQQKARREKQDAATKVRQSDEQKIQ